MQFITINQNGVLDKQIKEENTYSEKLDEKIFRIEDYLSLKTLKHSGLRHCGSINGTKRLVCKIANIDIRVLAQVHQTLTDCFVHH